MKSLFGFLIIEIHLKDRFLDAEVYFQICILLQDLNFGFQNVNPDFPTIPQAF